MRFLFADCVLDTGRRELARGSQPVGVQPQVFDLLVYLVANRERVVSKDDLLSAVWAGRIVSESTLISQISAARKAIGDNGEAQKLIRTIARKGFRFVGAVSEEQSAGRAATAAGQLGRGEALTAPTLAPAVKPSLAVLPFENLSGDPDQDYFADGMVEDIITALSRLRWLFVIARNSSFIYKGRAVDVKQVGRELGVRYLLEGSVRKLTNRVRISGQLIDATTGAHLWAERFEGSADDIFELQDQMTASVVGAIAPKLEQAESERATRKPTENLDAYDYYLRGMLDLNRRSREATSSALHLFSKAIERDGDFASAYGMAAWCHVWRKYNGWMSDRVQENSEGARLARRAVELGRDDAVALGRGGYALGFLAGEFDSGLVFLERALRLNPNLATTWVLSGLFRNFLGEPELAIEHLAHAMRLSPLDPTSYHMQAGTGFAHFLAGRFDEACKWAERALREEPGCTPAAAVTAAAHALAGRLQEAQREMAHLRQVYPALRVTTFTGFTFRRPEHLALWRDGLRKAGLPE
ncbi:MAG TPA: winged helix-turn-helix domain-containing tetratricopeptide repeat protein [Hyphomicrobiaceae bacterium]|nr:winged helix-turn-helix domain-containing tetratricopeptide repeat protein [Hyphomicrobiaceae bacterium]HEU0160317.1 winged helix-turn-helix domain-containing tetratricopeptide repeat protein [Hyphomicrobiaceae bacterium]